MASRSFGVNSFIASQLAVSKRFNDKKTMYEFESKAGLDYSVLVMTDYTTEKWPAQTGYNRF